MAIADKNQHVDNNPSIDHAVPNCTSNELFKYVLDDQSTGAFAGLVLVRPDALHTNSQQTNRNLCATRDARMYTQPQLEIYADDVKCSHGATVGQSGCTERPAAPVGRKTLPWRTEQVPGMCNM